MNNDWDGYPSVHDTAGWHWLCSAQITKPDTSEYQVFWWNGNSWIEDGNEMLPQNMAVYYRYLSPAISPNEFKEMLNVIDIFGMTVTYYSLPEVYEETSIPTGIDGINTFIYPILKDNGDRARKALVIFRNMTI